MMEGAFIYHVTELSLKTICFSPRFSHYSLLTLLQNVLALVTNSKTTFLPFQY